MLLMSVSDAVSAISAKCGGSAPDDTDAGVMLALSLLTPKVEAALEVDSLTLGDWNDVVFVETPSPHFYRNQLRTNTGYLGAGYIVETGPGVHAHKGRLLIRLANAFLTCDDIIVTDPCGNQVTPIDLDRERGIVTLGCWERGMYRIRYTAGFEPTPAPLPTPDGYDENMAVLQYIPDWLRLIVVTYLVQWFRTMKLAPKVPKGTNYDALMQATQRAVISAIRGKFERPRGDILFAEARRFDD